MLLGFTENIQDNAKKKNPPVKPLSRFTFENVVHDKNIGLQIPKKDRRDTCITYETKHIDEISYRNHIKNKEAARSVKSADKELGEKGECIVLTQDLQAVKVCARRKTHDRTVNSIKVIKYSPDGTIQVKLNFDDEYMDLPHRTSRNEFGNLCGFPQLRNEPIKIKYQKWQLLQELKKVIPLDCGSSTAVCHMK
ncbi:hypothetical protein PR048_018213 [Dryococelus australis]|uniref:Uncharacterized protein n=1 Tax=Dryococelus australis TaxID=614101 RepID=A0ABQ9HBN3_9NEOP|nr:hypothetical protein PR048_018213 [Dryococelus australis]